METADVALRLSLYLALLLMSGFFSGSETAMFSVGPVQLMRLQQEGHPRANLLETLLGQPRRLIATIFIGNEFVNIGASALLASISDFHLRPYGPLAVTVFSTLISVVLILMLGEITPKNLAAQMPERWALRAARPIWLLAAVMAPLRWTIERIADAVVHLVGGQEPPVQAVGEDEFLTMVDAVRDGGEIDESEQRLIHNVFEFGDRRVTDVMTPREEVFAVSHKLGPQQLIEQVRSRHYSRIPVYKGSRERVVGVLNAKDLVAVAHGVRSPPRRLQELLHPAYFVPKTTMCEQLFREFRRRRAHIALVVDEYGGVAGLVTMEDLLEEIFGEIMDEKEVGAPTGETAVAGAGRGAAAIEPGAAGGRGAGGAAEDDEGQVRRR